MHVDHDKYPGTKCAWGLANMFPISNQVLPAMGLTHGVPEGNQNDLVRCLKDTSMEKNDNPLSARTTYLSGVDGCWKNQKP